MTLEITIKANSAGAFNPTLGNLPDIIAQDEGLYAEEGVTVNRLVQEKAWRVAPHGETNVEKFDSFARHPLFEEGSPEVFGACEWGNIRRAYDSQRGGKVIGRGSGVGTFAILVGPGSPYVNPRTLHNQPVSVRFHLGSHYVTLELLEGFLKRDEIKVVNQNHVEGFEAVRRGEVAAITLMEPWITLGVKQGFTVIAETPHNGTEVGAPDVDPAAYAAYSKAQTRAVDRINADKAGYVRRYFPQIVRSLPEQYQSQLAPEDFDLLRLTWTPPRPYPEEEFQRTYDWLVGWDLVAPDATYDSIVNRSFALAGA